MANNYDELSSEELIAGLMETDRKIKEQAKRIANDDEVPRDPLARYQFRSSQMKVLSALRDDYEDLANAFKKKPK